MTGNFSLKYGVENIIVLYWHFRDYIHFPRDQKCAIFMNTLYHLKIIASNYFNCKGKAHCSEKSKVIHQNVIYAHSDKIFRDRNIL